MKVTLSSTAEFVTLPSGERARIWIGSFEGHAVRALIPGIGLVASAPPRLHTQFLSELTPRPDLDRAQPEIWASARQVP